LRQISINLRPNRVLYNVTISVDSLKYGEWMRFMRENHIPKIFSTGCFESYRICRIIGEESGGIGVAMQYVAISQPDLERYLTEYAPQLKLEHQEAFGETAVAFRSVLTIIEEGEWAESQS